MSAMPMRRIDAPRRRRGTASRTARPRVPLARRDGLARASAADALVEQSPSLVVVPRRRLAANAAALAVVVIGVLMLSAVVLHTRLAERQLRIDRLEQQVTEHRGAFDVLRQQRAELRSPTRLATESSRLGMVDAPRSDFVTADPNAYAQVLAAMGAVDTGQGDLEVQDPLDQVRRVRAADFAALAANR
ncbi:hypothetical protein BH24ACT5_BH24ACT5_14690 [soil metagenome]